MTPEEEANIIADAAAAALVKQGVKCVSKNGRVELAPLDAMLVAGRLRDARVVTMHVMGVDLSLTSTGLAHAEGNTELLKPGLRHGPERLAWIRDAILQYTVGIRHDVVIAVEGYSFNSHSSAYDLGELGGVVRTALYEAGIRYVDVPPATVKGYATGKGNANKNEVLVAAVKRLGYDGTSGDEADTLWCRAALLAVLGEPVVDMPQAHQKHLEKLAVLVLG